LEGSDAVGGTLHARAADFVKVWQDSRRQLMPRTVMEFLIAEAHRNTLRVVAHTQALSDFKHLLRSGVDAFAHPTWRQTEVEPVDDELIALFKAHPGVPVMTSMWMPRDDIYGARPYLPAWASRVQRSVKPQVAECYGASRCEL
jgi:hypothetical protein